MTELVRPEDAKIVKPQEKPGSVGERLHNVELALTNLARWVEALMAEMERMDARLSALEAKQPDFDTEGTA